MYRQVPCDPREPESSLIRSIRHMQPCVLLAPRGAHRLLEKASTVATAVGIPLIELELERSATTNAGEGMEEIDHIRFCLPAHGNATPPNEQSDTVLMLPTSGTTGEAKIVSFTLRRLLAAGAQLAISMGLSTADVGINIGMPLHHVGGIACNLMAPLISRGRMIFRSMFSASEWLESIHSPLLLEAAQPTVTWCYAVPAMWRVIIRHVGRTETVPRHQLRLLRSGSAPLSHEDAMRLSQIFGCSVLPTYSMTECMPIASPPLDYQQQRPGSVGTAVGSLCIVIRKVGEEVEVAPGVVGEVTLMGGDQLFNGYEEQDRWSGYFRTGDLGRMDEDGWLYLSGRVREVRCE